MTSPNYSTAVRLFVILAALLTPSCAIHSQAPVKEVAYDFSDRDFYDRGYAPSPGYAETTIYIEYARGQNSVVRQPITDHTMADR